jgi:hypothetical protein
MRKAISTAFALAAFASTSAHAAFFTNGDFEAGTLSPWTIEGNVFYVGPQGAPLWFGGGNAADNGTRVIAFNADNEPPNGFIQQIFDVVDGETYQVGYFWGATAGAMQQVTASVLGSDGTTILESQDAVHTNPPAPLQPFGFSFVADGNQATLRFTDWVDNETFNVDGILDNVSVTGLIPTVIPEPQTYALMLAGLGLLGFAAQRRRFSGRS